MHVGEIPVIAISVMEIGDDIILSPSDDADVVPMPTADENPDEPSAPDAGDHEDVAPAFEPEGEVSAPEGGLEDPISQPEPEPDQSPQQPIEEPVAEPEPEPVKEPEDLPSVPADEPRPLQPVAVPQEPAVNSEPSVVDHERQAPQPHIPVEPLPPAPAQPQPSYPPQPQPQPTYPAQPQPTHPVQPSPQPQHPAQPDSRQQPAPQPAHDPNRQPRPMSVPEGVQVAASGMTPEMQEHAIQVTKEAIASSPNEPMRVAQALMVSFEQKYGVGWHCAVSDGHLGFSARYDRTAHIYFSCGNMAIFLYKEEKAAPLTQ